MLSMALLLIAGIAWAAGDASAPLRRYAFVAGSNDGGQGVEKLKYAESDARSFAAVLQDLGGVRPQDLVLVVSPSLQRFEDGLARVRQLVRAPREMDERRELVIYYSGHSDDNGLFLGQERISWDSLRKDIDDIPADVKIAIMDSCSSGSLTRAKGGVSRPAFLFDVSSDMTGHAYLTSASAEEAAQESDRIGGSFFTHYLISGLRGAADAAGDALVTLDEAYAYAYQETLASTEKTQYGPQHPAWEIELAGSGKLVLTDLRTSTAKLTIADDVTGRLYIRDSDGNLAVELNKQYGQPVELGLEPGTYSIVLDGKSNRLAGDVRVTSRAPATLTLAQLHAVSTEAAAARGTEAAADASAASAATPPAPAPASPRPGTDTAAVIGAAIGASIGSAISRAADPVSAALNAVAAVVAAAAAAAPDAKSTPASPPSSAPGAQQPAPPGPVPQGNAPANPASPSKPRTSAFRIGIFPDMGAGVFSSTDDHVAAVNLLVGLSGSSLGFEVGGLANFESGNVVGFQAGGFANGVKGDVTAFQAAGLVNYAGGQAMFMQSAGLLNVSTGLLGAQAAGLANVNLGDTGGVQLAGLFNWSAGKVSGAQVAGVFNWAGTGMAGAQVAGVANWGADVHGPQISVINVGDTVTGAQIGVVNIARHVVGAQIGVLNISDRIDGIPLGLISVERQGRHDVDLWVDVGGSAAAAFSLGAKHFYTVVTGGWTPGTDPAQWSFGLGLGGRSDIGPFFLDYDAALMVDRQGFTAWPDPIGETYPRARIVLGLPLFGGDISVFAGVSSRVLVPYLSAAMAGADPATAVFQPSFIVGVHL